MRSNLSPELAKWAQKKSGEGKYFSSLGEIVLGMNRLRYFLYRTRFLLLNVCVRLALHVLEFMLVLHTLPELMIPIMLLRLSSIAVEGGWWGVLDSMRYRIRLLKLRQQTEEIRKEISGWLSISYVGGGILVALSFIVAVTVFYGLPSLQWLVVAVGVQTALRIVSRTYYSGAYALKRVFFPFELIIGIEVIVFLAGLGLHGTTAQWTLPLCIMVASACSALVSYRYAMRVTDFLRISPDRRFHPGSIYRTVHKHSPRLILRAGGAMLMMRLQDVLLILVLQSHAGDSPSLYALMFGLYLIMPLLRNAMSWSNIMFYDLTRYQYDIFKNFRSRFERLGMIYSLLLSTVYAVCGGLIMYIFTPAAAPHLLFVGLYFLLCAVLGFMLVSIFARRMYRAVMIVCVVQYVLFLIASINTNGMLIILLFGLLLAVVIARMYLKRDWLPPAQQKTSFVKWRSEMSLSRAPAVLYMVRFHRETPVNFRRSIINELCQLLPPHMQYFFFGDGVYLSCVGEAPGRIPNETFVMAGGGYIESLEYVEADNGAALIGRVEAARLLPASGGGTGGELQELIRHFQWLFPKGYVQIPMYYNPQLAKELDSQDVYAIVHAALSHSQQEKSMPSQRFLVSTAHKDGLVEAIFMIPRNLATSETRSQWRSLLEDYHQYH